jgi:hypothetical protein
MELAPYLRHAGGSNYGRLRITISMRVTRIAKQGKRVSTGSFKSCTSMIKLIGSEQGTSRFQYFLGFNGFGLRINKILRKELDTVFVPYSPNTRYRTVSSCLSFRTLTSVRFQLIEASTCQFISHRCSSLRLSNLDLLDETVAFVISLAFTR